MLQPRFPVRFTASVSCGALALALAASPAPAKGAEDACGAPANGIVHCEASDAPFPAGIQYSSDADIALSIEEGLSVAPDAYSPGVLVSSSGGSVVIDASGADVTSRDAAAIAAFAAGDVTIAADDVEAIGVGAWGISSFSMGGDTMITADTVTTGGDDALGIVAEGGTGSISISANSIRTSGLAADAVTVRSGGDIDVAVGEISGEGDYLWGVNVADGQYADGEIVAGHTRIEVDGIAISGDHAVGVNAFSYGSTDIELGSLTIDGDDGIGVRATGDGDVSVEIGEAVFTGQNSGGILAFSYGEASVRVGNVTAENGGGIVAFGIEGARAEADKIVVSGDFANGIQSVSQDGDARVKVGEVSTNGFFATAVNGDALNGDLTIEAGKITTSGELAMGIRAFGRTSSIAVSGPIGTDGYSAFGILNATTHGDAVVRTGGAVSTTGDLANAVWVTGRYGTADVRTSGKVSTSGDGAHAIRADAEDGQVEVVADEVETSGANSDGIRSRTRFVEIFLGQPGIPEPVDFTGDVDITAETVSVTGAGSRGISARGIGKAVIDAGTVSAFDSFAIETNMIEDVSITVRKAATSTSGSAIFAEGEDVTVTLASGASVAGGEHGIVIKAMGDRCVMRNPRDGSANPCPNPGDEWGNPDPELAAADELAPGAAIVSNAGTIKGGGGYAIKVERGTLSVANSGTITGAVLLGDGDDRIENSGTFEVEKDSDFGAGNDLFRNSGTVRLAAATTPKAYAFANLETLENSGTVDLRNGIAGDTFNLSGNYTGEGSAALGLDVDLENGIADRFTVAGAATGTTSLVLGLAAGEARLTGDSEIVLVEVGEDSSGSAFTLGQDIGFIHYGLSYDADARRYLLESVAGPGAYRQLNALEAVDGAWHSSVDAWRSNETATRDAELSGSDGGRSRLWGEIHGGRASRKSKSEEAGVGGSQLIDHGYRQDVVGTQLGYDLAGSPTGAGSFRFGATAGYARSTLESRAVDDEEIAVRTLNLGAYAGFSAGALWGNLLAKYDLHRLTFDSATAGLDDKVKGSTLGIEAEAGARFGGSVFFVEPVAGLAWTRTDLNDLSALGQALDFKRSDGLRATIGARFGGRSKFGNGDSLNVYASAKAVHDFGKAHQLTLVSGEEREELSSSRIRTIGEGILGLSYNTRSGLEGFVEGQGELGSGYDSLAGRVGVRARF